MLLEKNKHQTNSYNFSHHGRNMDRMDDLTLVEIEKIEYYTVAHVNAPLAHPLNLVMHTESE